jgi:YebC/PmpR family DNA-binding regulatory protein
VAGHSKWSKVKHKKAVTDARKSAVFSKYARLIALESKRVKGDAENPALKRVIEKARKENMPQENISRAVQKGIGTEGQDLFEVVYEAYGPGGAAMIIEGITDNKNRTGAGIKHILAAYGTELASPGSALWAFKKEWGVWTAVNTISLAKGDRERMEALIEELKDHEDIEGVYTNAR